jgi:hypothetical protein
MHEKKGLTVLLSWITEAVRPAADEPFPEVYTAIGAVFSTNLRNCKAQLSHNVGKCKLHCKNRKRINDLPFFMLKSKVKYI